jgi:RecA/RadA recombinase
MTLTTVNTEQREAVIAAIRKQYHDHTVMTGSKMPSVQRLMFPSRVDGFEGIGLAMNYITGGGLPWHRMSRFWGGPGTAKTYHVWMAILAAQNYGKIMHDRFTHQSQIARLSGDKKLANQLRDLGNDMGQRYANGLECVYFNIENQWDPDYVKALGVDTDRLEIVNSQRVEDIGTQAELMIRAFHVLVFDSCTNAVTVEEMNHKDGLYHHPVGVRVFKWGQVLSWLNDRLNADNVLIYVDQIRSQFGMNSNQRFEQEKAPGGHMMEHNSSMTLHFVKGKHLYRKPDGSLRTKDSTMKVPDNAFGQQESEGREIHVRCDKSRIGKGERTALLHLDKTKKNLDTLFEYDKLARYFGIAKRTSANSTWWVLPDGQKTQNLRQHIAENSSFRAAIEDITLRCAADPEHEQQVLRGLAA